MSMPSTNLSPGIAPNHASPSIALSSCAIDLRRTCAKLCHDSGGELEQIQFLLGHASVQTTEHYRGCKQNLGHPVNDLFELKTDSTLAARIAGLTK
jgi:integrase